jgi:proteic killer suppression protein
VIRSVVIAESAQKQLRKVPRYVAEKLADWALAVEAYGLDEIRKVPGYHDESLKGKRAGQRSIRLSRAYRAIYIISDRALEFVSVEEVHKHDY